MNSLTLKWQSVLNRETSTNSPLPLGSLVKLSRLTLNDNEQITPQLLDNLKKETFEDSPNLQKNGVYVKIINQYKRIWIHIIEKDIIHLAEQQEQYQFWQ